VTEVSFNFVAAFAYLNHRYFEWLLSRFHIKTDHFVPDRITPPILLSRVAHLPLHGQLHLCEEALVPAQRQISRINYVHDEVGVLHYH